MWYSAGMRWAALGLGLVVSACITVSDPNAKESGWSGSGPVTASCYLSTNKAQCDCLAKNDDANRPAADWTKVATCNTSVMSGTPRCTVDTTVAGTTSSCFCLAFSCRKTSGFPDCRCEATNESGGGISSCTGNEWYCAANDGTSCYGGHGNFGSACGNDEHNVSSCALSSLKPGKNDKTSCDGLTFAKH
jgi:hypothetical protein